jgi:hypothetical protein
MLYISWKHHEGDYLARQNPIVQAMTPEPPPPPPKPMTSGGSKKKQQAAAPAPPSRPTVAFNQDIELLTNSANAANMGSAFGQTPMNPAPRRAADYEPPASFLQNMDRPGPGRVPKEGAKGNVLADLWAFN